MCTNRGPEVEQFWGEYVCVWGGRGGIVDETVSTAQWTEMFSRASFQGLLYTPVILLSPRVTCRAPAQCIFLLLFQKSQTTFFVPCTSDPKRLYP